MIEVRPVAPGILQTILDRDGTLRDVIPFVNPQSLARNSKELVYSLLYPNLSNLSRGPGGADFARGITNLPDRRYLDQEFIRDANSRAPRLTAEQEARFKSSAYYASVPKKSAPESIDADLYSIHEMWEWGGDDFMAVITSRQRGRGVPRYSLIEAENKRNLLKSDWMMDKPIDIREVAFFLSPFWMKTPLASVPLYSWIRLMSDVRMRHLPITIESSRSIMRSGGLSKYIAFSKGNAEDLWGSPAVRIIQGEQNVVEWFMLMAYHQKHEIAPANDLAQTVKLRRKYEAGDVFPHMKKGVPLNMVGQAIDHGIDVELIRSMIG